MKLNPDFDNSSFDFFCCAVSPADGAAKPRGYHIGRANLLDLLRSHFSGGPRISWSRQLRRGDRYFVARAGRRIVAVARICFADTPEVVLDAGEASLISFYTVPEHRGRGLYPALIHAMLGYLQQRGFKAAYIWADRSNQASIRGIEKTGFKRLSAAGAAE